MVPRGLLLAALLIPGALGAAPPPGPRWQGRCLERVEQARRALGATIPALRAARITSAVVDETTREAWLRSTGDGAFALHLVFRTGEQPPLDPAETRWSDRLLDVKRPQRLLTIQRQHRARGLQAELAVAPDAAGVDAVVRALRRAVDGCARDLAGTGG